MKSIKARLILILVILGVLSGIAYVHKELKRINACASQMNESECFENYDKDTRWYEKWF
ncbi:MAG: hypothetical protein V4644_02730 [Patescibacteria group bacterium]